MGGGFSFSLFTRRSYTQSHDRTLGLRVTGGLDTNAVWVDAVNGDSKIFALRVLFYVKSYSMPGILQKVPPPLPPVLLSGASDAQSSPIGDSAGPPAKAIA